MPIVQVAQNTIDKTWQAINVTAQGIGEMSFGSAQLVDETTSVSYKFRQGEPVVSIDLPLDHKVGASFLCTNTGEIALKVFVYVAIIDPDGLTRAEAWNPRGTIPQTVNPGVGYYSDYIGGVSLDKLGLWLIYGRIEYEIA